MSAALDDAVAAGAISYRALRAHLDGPAVNARGGAGKGTPPGLLVTTPRASRPALARAIEDTRRLYASCRCELNAALTNEELQALEGGCTAPYFVCPRLDAVRRRVRS